jgi:uncharacterized protein YfaS (alpha-2-macroglobulin family)
MKRIIFYLSIIALLFTTFSFSSCGRNKKGAASEDEFTPYISAYTGGVINRSSSIQIELVNEQPDIEPNTEIKEKLFSFSPSIKGKAYWVNNRTIEFVPEENQLRSGQNYNAEFKLGKILDVDKKFKVFYFTFFVSEKSFAIQVNPLTISDSESVVVSGDIRFSDDTDLALVKKAFSATISDSQALDYEIMSTNDAKIFRFVINNIKRKKTDLDLYITIDGKALDINKTQTEKVVIPDNTFKVLSAELIAEPADGVQIVFSDHVSTTQDLRGLISIKELSGINFQVMDNRVNIYFSFDNLANITLKVNTGVKNTKGENLKSDFETELTVEKLNPQVVITKSGNIIPNSERLQLPFRAVNLNAVDLRIIQIFENNVLMFLQDNNLSGSEQLRRSGRLVYKKTFRLDSDPTKNLHNWQDYSIDLSNIMKQQQGAIYRIELSFKQEYSVYPCDENSGNNDVNNTVSLSSNEITESEEDYWDSPSSYYYDSYYTDDYNWEEYDWNERDNPCHKSYFMIADKKAVVNVMTSNIGIIAKANDENKLWISVANILDTKPISGAMVTVYNFQLQPIGTVQTDNDGFAFISLKGKAFVLVAESEGQKSYLRLVDGESNSLSRFDVGGKKIEKGLKGFIYGERGVWRPGDTLFVTFMLHDLEKRIPDTHPVSFEMYNPQGQFYTKQVSTKGVNGFYSFKIPTKADDPTGLWNAYIKVGGTSFHKSFRIETIKPNRLKINVNFGKDILNADEIVPVTLTSSWLTGATASNLKTEVEMTLSKTQTQFKGYEKFIFNNPATDFSSSEEKILSGTLNSEGEIKSSFKTPKAEDAPGMLNATIVARVFEQGGDASIFSQVLPFSPFSSYVGINLNQEEGKYIETDTEHTFDIVTLNAQGKLVDRNNLEYKIYRVDWSWWWEKGSESFSNYVNNSSYTPVAKGKLQTINGKTNFKFTLNYPEWGRYLVYVKDKNSGHAAGGLVYIDWPSSRGRSNKTDPNNIKMLSFTSDKKSYEIDEDITVTIPEAGGGTALIALENGSTVLSRTWIQLADKGDTKYTFKATKDMAPNFYVHISLLQPHAQTVNDLPIRMYGVIPVFISNKESVLEPQINMPDVLRPETEFTVNVSEKNGRAMTYTVAVVDDGLLDLTNFKTPNPWNEFYAREALGIRTWDMYDFIMGAFGGKFSSMFSVGGDEELKQGDAKANRFRPVVKYLGPFTLAAGKTNAHKITLPMYVGSVRTMVVAGQDAAYGNAEKTTPVRAPLMILSSLPRVVSTDEEIMLPINVFAMESNVKNVSVKVETSGLLQATDGNSKSITFSQTGDQMLYFPMKTSSKSGIEKVTITATGGGNTAKETIEIDVRNPNPAIIISDNKLVEAGKTADFNYSISGNSNDDWVKMEVSRIPSMDITRRFDFLYNYQNNCSEQLTSRALPLLYISQFKEIDSQESEMIRKNVQEAIRIIYGRQLLNGGIVMWPGQSSANDWITSYVGMFLTLAKEKGYEVNDGVLNKLKSYQHREAQNWRPSTANNYYSGQSEYAQAFRLYSLALANAADLGAMNRMKEMNNLSTQARWQLAAAYAVNGKVNAAQELIFKEDTYIEPYSYSSTFGSSDRDEAMILQTMILMDDMQNAFTQAQKVSENLSRENQFSTQSTAFSLVAMGMLAQKTSGSIDFNWSLNGKKQDDVKSTKAVFQKELPKNANGNISFINNGKGILYVNVVSKSKPLKDTLPEIANNLRIQVAYSDLNGNAINIQNLKQSTDFVAEVKVTNISPANDYTDLALTHIIPAGWEIFNERMIGNTEDDKTSSDFTYQDIRDDRVLTYFDLPRNRSKVIKVRLQSSYIGSFVLPAVQCEAMYDTSAFAKTKAGRVKVVK